MQYPRIYVTAQLHNAVKKAATKENLPMNKIGSKIVLAGLKTLGYKTK